MISFGRSNDFRALYDFSRAWKGARFPHRKFLRRTFPSFPVVKKKNTHTDQYDLTTEGYTALSISWGKVYLSHACPGNCWKELTVWVPPPGKNLALRWQEATSRSSPHMQGLSNQRRFVIFTRHWEIVFMPYAARPRESSSPTSGDTPELAEAAALCTKRSYRCICRPSELSKTTLRYNDRKTKKWFIATPLDGCVHDTV